MWKVFFDWFALWALRAAKCIKHGKVVPGMWSTAKIEQAPLNFRNTNQTDFNGKIRNDAATENSIMIDK